MQTFVSEQYGLKDWKMQLVFVQTCYVNIDSRYSKNAEITTCEYIQNGQNLRPKNTLKYLLSMNTEVDKPCTCVHEVKK